VSIIDKFINNGLIDESAKKRSFCRIEIPGGGALEIRTSGNINFSNDDVMTLANANYKLGEFQENYDNYFSGPRIIAGPSSEEG
jgi:hypothetical protein